MSGVAPVKKSTWFVDKSEYAVSAHGSFSCEECHSTLLEDDQEHPDPTDQAFLKKEPARSYDYSQCRRCHPDNYARYGTGVHAEALKKDLLTEETPSAPAMPAPTCGSCHSSHYAKAKLSRVESGMFMVETCGTCHPEETRSYLKNYHGKTAVYHKMEDSALCTDCHGAHRCVSLQENTQALAACRRCHPEATDEFAEYVIHATTAGLSEEEEDKRAKVELIHLIEIIGVIFVVAVLGFFYFHTIIWFLRRMHEKLRKR
jgi:methylphosphotriester-DNA--protein-cysteine methyltransferase